jgi:nitrogen regulatory protein P-II 1
MSLAMIVAIIKPHKLDDVKEALLANGVEGMTITEVRGFGRQRGKTENFRGSEYNIDFVPKLKVEVIVPDTEVDKLVSVVADAAKTGKIGDGKVWSIGIDRLLRVRTGETGHDAV